MVRNVVVLILLAKVVSLSGCGTIENVRNISVGDIEHTHVFGGVQIDAEELSLERKMLINESGCYLALPDYLHILGMCCTTIDMPFSLVGDVLTLPVTISTTVMRMERNKGTQLDSGL
jgi:uncharacterized protein YceK